MSTESFMRAALEADLLLSIEGQRELLALLDAERTRADAAEAKLARAQALPRTTIPNTATGHVREYIDVRDLAAVLTEQPQLDPYSRSADA